MDLRFLVSPDVWGSEGMGGGDGGDGDDGGEGAGISVFVGALCVDPSGPRASVMWNVFMSNCGRNSVTGLKGSLSKNGNR